MRHLAVRALLASLLVLPALLPAAARADARADIIASHAAMVEKGRFKVVSEITSGEDRTVSTATVVWPDRYHMVNQVAPGQTMEVIIVPGATYMKQGGEWQRFPMDMGAMIKAFTPDAMKQSQENMAEIEDLGRETVDGRDTRKFRYTTSATVMGIRSTSTVTAWIDADTRLPVRQEVEGVAMGRASTTVQTYTFDDDLAVEAPL